MLLSWLNRGSIRNAKIEARNVKGNTTAKYYNDNHFHHTSNEDLKRLSSWGNVIGKNTTTALTHCHSLRRQIAFRTRGEGYREFSG
jgi:hypothetical protein